MEAKKKIWIDFDNSPHVPFFKPIIDELNKRGYMIMLTARNCFQTCGLADYYNLHYKRIGKHYGKNKIMKVLGLIFRALQLAPTVLKEKPDLAISHGSRAQIITAYLLRIPSVVIFDYEHAKWILLYPKYLISPEIIPDGNIKRGRRTIKIFHYPGIKEDIYVPNFKPDPSIKYKLGINGEYLVVTMRPPATEAHYHNPQSETLFEEALNFLGQNGNTRLVMLPRSDKQKAFIKKHWTEWCSMGKIIIPDHVVNGLNLMWYSDLVISGGGTMNREAAALGVPVYSIFRGKIGAVDKYLAENGRLTLIENEEDIKRKILLIKRDIPKDFKPANKEALQKIVDIIVDILREI